MISREQAEKYFPAKRLPALEQSPADDGHLIGRDPRRMSISELTALGHQAGPLLAVIRAKCLDCVGDELGEVRKCTAVDCALWPFRMAHNPFREISQAQREGRITVPVTLDGVGVDWLIREARALAEADAGNRAEIGAAISRLISVSSRK